MKLIYHTMRLLMLIVFADLYFYSFTFAQKHRTVPFSQYIHRAWTNKEGLPHNSGRAFVQTQDGYIWIATQDGLVRFDGAVFQVFDIDNTPALKHNDITSLVKIDGTLWIGTYNGLTSLQNGIFTYHPTNAGRELEIVRDLALDNEGNLWVGTMNAGIYKYKDGNHQSFQQHKDLPTTQYMQLQQIVKVTYG